MLISKMVIIKPGRLSAWIRSSVQLVPRSAKDEPGHKREDDEDWQLRMDHGSGFWRIQEYVLMPTPGRLSVASAFEFDAAHLHCAFHGDVGFAEE